MKWLCVAVLLCSFLAACSNSSGGGGKGNGGTPPPSNTPFWAQWGGNPQHNGVVSVAGQSFGHQLADIVYDPFVPQEQAEFSGDLVAHYQATLVDGNDFYTVVKGGNYVSCNPHGAWTNGAPCGPNTWRQQIWSEARYTWINGAPSKIWTYQSDWKPEVNTNAAGLGGWEPVFHPLDANGFIYVPGAGGAIWKLNKTDGSSASHITPLGAVLDPNTTVSGPLAADSKGNIYYNVIKLADPSQGDPWFGIDVQGAWLVKVTPSDVATTATYASLLTGAPIGTSTSCPGTFNAQVDPPPWPPSTNAVPLTQSCGSQRPGVNVAPAIASDDNTIYTVSTAHFDPMVSYLIAVKPDLSLKWAASMQNLLTDGCGGLIPIATAANPNAPNSCRVGANPGVDPDTNAQGSGEVIDQSSSSPMVLPDGSVLYGAITNYAFSRGHLMKFDSNGAFIGAYSFGWDSTPAVLLHNGTYSVVIKDNHYPSAAYCFAPGNPVCQAVAAGPYYITRLSADLKTVEWSFQNTTIDINHPNGYEWCVNAPATDTNGMVYANSEDGNIYSIHPDGTMNQKMFLKLALGAAYTPVSLGPDGKFYLQNDGHLFVVGN